MGPGEAQPPQLDSEYATVMVELLRRRYRDGKTRPLEWRTNQLKMLIKMLEDEEDEIACVLRADLRKGEMDVILETGLVKGECRMAIKNLRKWMTPEKVETALSTYPSSSEIVAEPLGVVLIIGTWNYPILLGLQPVIGAIAAGNAVVLKPSDVAPATSSFLAKTIPKYLDNSCIRVVEGGVPEVTALLEQKWDKIFYTGNSRIARVIMRAATKHLTPVVLELGGKSPTVVDSNVNLRVAARRIAVAKWGCNNGQACISPDYIITPRSFAPSLIEALVSTIKEFYGEEPMNSKDLARIVNARHFNRLASLLDEKGIAEKIVHGGQRDKEGISHHLIGCPLDSLVMKEEIFGPLLPIITVDKLEESFELIRTRGKPLAAYMFTKNKKLANKFADTISAGTVCINEAALHVTSAYLPFGGVGESGMGVCHGKYSFDTFSHKKPVMRRTFGGDISARYPPFTPKKKKIIRAMLRGDILGMFLAFIGLT